MKIRHFIFSLLLSATCFGANQCETPLLTHVDNAGNEREFQNVYQCITSSVTVVPSGTIFSFAGSTAPVGFLNCDGSAVSRTTFSSLFRAIGTNWGPGDGSTTFNLPNLNRRALVGSGGSGSSVLGSTVGALGGEETHTQTTAEMPTHTHVADVTDPGHTHGIRNDSNSGGDHTNLNAFVGNGVLLDTVLTNSAVTGITVSNENAGSGNAFNQMQPSAVVLFIIKT